MEVILERSIPKSDAALKKPAKLNWACVRYRSVLAVSGVGSFGLISSLLSFLSQPEIIPAINNVINIFFIYNYIFRFVLAFRR
jgi:hypothetical protein